MRPNEDLLAIFQKRQLFLSQSFLSKILRRFISFQYVLKGEASFKAFWQNCLPGAWRSTDRDVVLSICHLQQKTFISFLKDVPKTSLRFLNLEFSLPDEKCFFEFAYQIQEVVVADQYDLKNLIQPDFYIIDAGANLGLFSFFSHYLAPKAKIYAFEPSPHIFEIFNSNIKRNYLEENIMAFPLALGEERKRATLLISNLNPSCNTIKEGGFWQTPGLVYDSEEKNISVETIDNFCQEHQIPRIDLIKIDTEGFEKQILKGAAKTIKKYQPIICCSAYHFRDDKTAIPKLISEINNNYQYRLLKKDEEVFVFQPKK